MISFHQKPLASFWSSVADKYTLLSQKTTNNLLPFCLYCISETAFLAPTNMKSKCRSRITVEPDL